MVSGELNDESGIFDLYGDLEDAYDKAECDGMREVVQTLDVFGIWDEGGHPPVWIMKRALLAIKGNPDEQAELAWCFDWSHEPKEERSRRYDNPRLAVYWYERAADAGVASAQCNVANIYCFTDDKKLWNGPRAVYWREKAAMQKYPEGLRGLAYCLECGKCCQGCADVVRAKALRDEADLLEKGVEEKYNLERRPDIALGILTRGDLK